MKRFYIIKESLLATIITLIITFCISFIPIKFEFIKGIRQGFLGFDIYDLYYSGKHVKNAQRDTNIVIVEIGADREAIANQVTLIQKYSPAVIGIDAVFDREDDPLQNIKLFQAISNSDNIIFSSKYIKNPVTGKMNFIRNYFDQEDAHYQSGYFNFLGNQLSVIRNYPPFLKIDDSVYLSFTSAIVKRFSLEKFNKLEKRKKKMEIINYIGNLESYTSISKEQLLYYDSTGQMQNLLKNKVVLLGFFDKEAPLLMEDLHFSPLNEVVAGKSFPDMYGVVIHANILSMIINDNYASQASGFISYLFAGAFTFLLLHFILTKYKNRKHPKHSLFLLVQFLFILLLLFLFLQVFDLFQIKVPLVPIMISLALCVELLGVYRRIALWLHKKYQYKTVFNHKHIL